MWIDSNEDAPPAPGLYWGIFYYVNRLYPRLVKYWGGYEWDDVPFFWYSESPKSPEIPDDIAVAVEAMVMESIRVDG